MLYSVVEAAHYVRQMKAKSLISSSDLKAILRECRKHHGYAKQVAAECGTDVSRLKQELEEGANEIDEAWAVQEGRARKRRRN